LYKTLTELIADIKKNNESIEGNQFKIDSIIEQIYKNALSLPNDTDPETVCLKF
jgi:hypothetical protein